MALELADELQIPDGREIISGTLAATVSTSVRYQHVNDAVSWIAANGKQNAFDSYMTSPAAFMRAIRR